jgi:sec-independent protein translocase protein TatC
MSEDPSHAPSENPEDDLYMGFFEHLGELRSRLVKALLGVVPGVALGWLFKERLLDLLVEPLITAWKKRGLGDPSIHFANPIDPFVAYLKMAIVAGVLVASPWIFWQLWKFVSPGLYRRERRLAVPFVLASTLFFVGGSLFGYTVVFPLGFETFLGFAGKLPSQSVEIQPTIMINEYLSFSTRLLLAFGIVFEVPVVITFLSAAGIVDWRQLLKFSRWWILVATLLSALLTPPDVGSQMLMIGPLVGLYFISIGFAWLFTRKKTRQGEPEEIEDDDEDPEP